jgi:hypothetical protein
MQPFDFAVVWFGVDRAGMLTSTVDWANAANDLDSAVLRGRCTREELVAETPGCDETAVLVLDDSLDKPSVLHAFVDAGEYTLVIISFGPGSDTASYRLDSEANVFPLPTPTDPTPTPDPPPSASSGSGRFLGGSLPEGSMVAVSPMFTNGQQAPQLSFSAAITLARSLSGALVRAWVRTPEMRCMGGGRTGVNFQADREQVVAPASMSNPGGDQPVCVLPYTTTHVEFEVLDGTGTPVWQQQFPAVYRFVTTRRTDTFAFTLPAGSQREVVVGPVRAGNGPVEVALTFSGDFIILACVGTQLRCIPMGGRPTTRSFTIPSDFPAGPVQATLYFNRNFPQPPGNAMGTVSFTYNPF